MKRMIDLKDVSDGRLYSSGDMVKADCRDCAGCSDCCQMCIRDRSYSSEQGPWTVGATFDQQLIYLLFADTLDASEELGISNEFTQQLEDTMEILYPINIGESGQIKEWQQEGAYNRYEGTNTKIGDDSHRHNSQLMALHPGNLITTETPELMEAARTTLELRGDGAPGWLSLIHI